VVLWTGSDEHARAAEADGLTRYRGDLTEDLTSGVPSDLEGLDDALAVGDDEALNAMIATATKAAAPDRAEDVQERV
jgi:hypothetical protein